MATDFSRQVRDIGKRQLAQLTAIRRRAVVLIGDELTKTKPKGGRVPFLTGTLSRSLVASTRGMPKIATTPPPGGNVGLVAATLAVNKDVWLGYTVAYARRRNYGFVGPDKLGRVYNETGDYFVEGAIAEWPKIVRKSITEVTRGR